MESVTIELPYPPSTNRYWRSFIPKGRSRNVTIRSEAANDYKALVAKEAIAAGIKKPFTGCFGISITLFPQKPKDWVKRAKKDPAGWVDSVRCIDLDNSLKVLLDSLNGIAFEDDKYARRITLERGDPYHVACVVVEIYKISQQEQPQQKLKL